MSAPNTQALPVPIPAAPPHAPLWRRGLGTAVDLAALAPVMTGLAWSWLRLFDIRVPSSRLPWFDWMVQLHLRGDPLVVGGVLVLGLVMGIYFGVSLALWGTTLGYRVMGLAVVDRDGRDPGCAASTVRALGGALSTVYLGLGYAWILFDAHRQGFHDKIAGTYVIRRKGR